MTSKLFQPSLASDIKKKCPASPFVVHVFFSPNCFYELKFHFLTMITVKYIPLKFQCIILGIFLPQVLSFRYIQWYDLCWNCLPSIFVVLKEILEIKCVVSECFFVFSFFLFFNLSHVYAFLDAAGLFRMKQALKQTSKIKKIIKLKTKKFYLTVFHERRFPWSYNVIQ